MKSSPCSHQLEKAQVQQQDPLQPKKKKGKRIDEKTNYFWVNIHAEYIMRNAGLDEAQDGIKIARRNINNLRYAYDTTLTAEREELQSVLMKVEEEWKSWLKTQHSEN